MPEGGNLQQQEQQQQSIVHQSVHHDDDAKHKETIESIIRGQRRMKGTIVSVEPGRCKIAGELGEFPFALAAVKENKRFPGREPKSGDRCDYKLSDTNPVKATSIRVIVPKTELLQAGGGVAIVGADEEMDASSNPVATTTTSMSSYPASAMSPNSIAAAIVPPHSGQGSFVSPSAGSANHFPLTQPTNCITASSFPGSSPVGAVEGGSGIDDLCCAFQRMGGNSGSLFSC